MLMEFKNIPPHLLLILGFLQSKRCCHALNSHLHSTLENIKTGKHFAFSVRMHDLSLAKCHENARTSATNALPAEVYSCVHGSVHDLVCAGCWEA